MNPAPALPRVLLVEDDASIRRFVELALDDMPIALQQAPTLAAARAVLAAAPVRLLITDLMLPDGNGVDLLRELAADSALRAGARLVAFSAGISAERRQQLLALGVDEILAKPVALRQLEDCVQRALATPAPAQAPTSAPQAAADGAAAAVARYFGGQTALFEAYRASCLLQFEADLRDGDAAVAAHDLAALRRLAHSLKSVLLTLGLDTISQQAATAELLAAGADAAAALAAWPPLRQALQQHITSA